MRRVACLTRWALLLPLPILAVGCVPQDRYDSLLTANRSLQEQLVSAEDERDEARANLQAVQEQLGRVNRSYDALQTRYNDLNGAFDQLEAENDDYLHRIAQLEIGPLPADVETALEKLTASHPNLLTFDASRGMLRFASDFTFDLGSADLKEDAASTIRALARILNETAAQGLEVQIVGHTDDVKIGRPETLRNHPTNMHLSVHRAIAVRDALTAAGVDPLRFEVAGYGPFRPVVPNGPHGAAENRRVEIYLGPMPTLAVRPPSSPAQPPTDATSAAAEERPEEPMK
jgi:chemotaxis protein MotB